MGLTIPEVRHTIGQIVEDIAQQPVPWLLKIGCPTIATRLHEKVHLPSSGEATIVAEALRHWCLTAESLELQRGLFGNQKTTARRLE
jgi:hypothetical protein